MDSSGDVCYGVAYNRSYTDMLKSLRKAKKHAHLGFYLIVDEVPPLHKGRYKNCRYNLKLMGLQSFEINSGSKHFTTTA